MIIILLPIAPLVPSLQLVRHFPTEPRSMKPCHIRCSVIIQELRKVQESVEHRVEEIQKLKGPHSNCVMSFVL